MTLQERLAEHAGRLTQADRQLLEVVLSHPTEAAFLPAGEVAGRAGVHQATATKLAQKLGYPGYPALREALQHDLLGGATPAERVRRRLEHAGADGPLESLIADEIAALHDLPRHVSQDAVDAAARLILGAGHVYVYGRGNATVLVELLHRRLRRYGLRSTPLPTSGRDLAEHLVGLREGDVVVAFAFLNPPRHLSAVLGRARSAGSRSLLITDTLTTLDERPDHVLAAPRGSGREFQSLTVPMAVTNSLILTLARLEPDRTLQALEDLRSLLDRLDE
ncbi:MurR/RpiR family transcriptional regulator [Jiangella alba]|uniref:DNA-binding transcriptional regulator, MurR/RpiR family, contains HTH and SIS domains n=1 Tax=Jiangella alba TaxID=561176 RepID=A0A1H5PPG8_9ACTN|nr:MurR/RpiR family transcriptional regulator [Jiangella alba]SEF15589.1 DNA-binding transcriptional regulator, MurR/RpiR family, contains HTH and SIS domains [Jiangella alba]